MRLSEHNAMSRTTAAALASALLESVTRHVRDAALLRAIAGDFRTFVDGPTFRRKTDQWAACGW